MIGHTRVHIYIICQDDEHAGKDTNGKQEGPRDAENKESVKGVERKEDE